MRLSIPQSFGDHITGGFFGGNFLANRDQIGEDGTTDELIAELGVTSLRYPGGSLTEHYFDISNPDQ
ncbi:MAG: type I secretion protein, partial [Pseudomonadota bacterium]